MPDVIILGAGVIGTSIAFHLARRGTTGVTVVDRAAVAEGGSGRSSALVRMHYVFPPEVQLAVKSLEYFRNWSEIVGRPGDFRETGFVRIVHPDEAELLKANVEMQRANGADARVVTGEELKEIEPDWFVEDVVAAAYEPTSGYGDGAAVAGDFLSRAREMGVEYRPGTRVTAFRVEGGRVLGVETDGGRIDAPVVMVATGPWTGPLFRAVGVDLPIEPEFHEVVALRNPPSMRGGGCACIDSITQTYLRPEGSDMTLIGDFHGKRGVDPDAFPETVSEESFADIVLRASHRIPALEEAGMARGVTGIYDRTPDSRPLLGPVPGVEGLFVAAGFSGMGFKISPAIGLVMSELLLDGRATTVDITPFRPTRFAEGRPVRAEFGYRND